MASRKIDYLKVVKAWLYLQWQISRDRPWIGLSQLSCLLLDCDLTAYGHLTTANTESLDNNCCKDSAIRLIRPRVYTLHDPCAVLSDPDVCGAMYALISQQPIQDLTRDRTVELGFISEDDSNVANFNRTPTRFVLSTRNAMVAIGDAAPKVVTYEVPPSARKDPMAHLRRREDAIAKRLGQTP